MIVPDFTAKMTSFNDMTWSNMIDGEPTKNNGININYLGTLRDILRYLFSFLYSSYYSSVLCFISYLFNFSKYFSSSSSSSSFCVFVGLIRVGQQLRNWTSGTTIMDNWQLKKRIWQRTFSPSGFPNVFPFSFHLAFLFCPLQFLLSCPMSTIQKTSSGIWVPFILPWSLVKRR